MSSVQVSQAVLQMIAIIPFAIICCMLLLMVFWVVQIISLMSMRDEDFTGRNDKILWFLIIFFGSIVGAFVFWIWKRNHAIRRSEEERLEKELKPFVNELLAMKKAEDDKAAAISSES